MTFTPFGWLGYLIIIALEVYGSLRVRDSNLKSLRWFLGFSAAVDWVMLATIGERQHYFDWYWYPQMIELCWIAWIAGTLVRLCSEQEQWLARLIIRLPAAVVAWLSWIHIPTTYLTAEIMDSYQWHALAISAGTCLIAFIFAAKKKHIPLAIALLLLCCLGIGCSALWWWLGYSVATWMIAWVASLVAILAAALRTSGPQHNHRAESATASA